MKVYADRMRLVGKRNRMIYGQFIEHFHRQIYGGIYDPGNQLSDGDGFREDVLDAMRKIKVPVLRWPGGCFVSSYHWEDAVGERRLPSFDKAWRVEEPNTFGTDEYIALCRKIGCEPYICTNAGTGTAEEMSTWVEYCNLKSEGRYARLRIENGHQQPYGVRYWSIGNENYGFWEIGSKTPDEWGHLAAESAKMMKHVDPDIELSAAALADVDWNVRLLQNCGAYLDWISIHDYWDPIHETNNTAPYEAVMAMTSDLESSVRKVRGLLEAMGLEKKIRIAYDEWNLRQWYHPKVHCIEQGKTKEEYLYPRDENDDNSLYTMADAVFTACFLNMVNRNCDIVGMANFSPVINTRGCIFTYPDGIVLRGTWYVFDLYVNKMGDLVLDTVSDRTEKNTYQTISGTQAEVDQLDILVTAFSDRAGYAIAAVNKDPISEHSFELDLDCCGVVEVNILNGKSTESFNDIGKQGIQVTTKTIGQYRRGMSFNLEPHTIQVISIR